MERTFKRKMSSARICQSYDLLHFTHCVGRSVGCSSARPSFLHMPRGGEEEAGLTGLILIAPGRSVRRVVRFNSIIKPERRKARDHDDDDDDRRGEEDQQRTLGGGGGVGVGRKQEKSAENSPATANNQRIPSFQKNSYKKRSRWTDRGRRTEGVT